jgi:hypothetical protein
MNTNMDTKQEVSPVRQATTNSLAVIGFVALVGVGLWLAVYSTRYVPSVVNRIGAAAVYIGSVFNPAPTSTLSVVPPPVASTTVSFGNIATSTKTTTTTQPTGAPIAAGTKTTASYPMNDYGLGDLSVGITSIGYLASDSTNSFVASPTVPAGDLPAIRFTIKNIGTNWTGTWSFSASIPTSNSYTFHSPVQQSLAPGDSIDYTLGFNEALTGASQPVTITIQSNIPGSNPTNTAATAHLDVLGS